MKSQTANPAKTGIMLVGAGGSLALAYWSISQATAPPPHVPHVPPAQTAPPVQSTPSRPLVTEMKGETELPSTDDTQNMIGHTPAAHIIQQSIGILAARQHGNTLPPAPTQPITGEAALAPGADPFMPYTQSSNEARPVANRRAAPLPSFTRPAGSSALPGPNIAPVAPEEPELAGTLLGDRPSAVFRVGKHLTTVSAGESFDGWTVMRVEDGEAVVMRANMRVHLHVGMNVARNTPTASDRPGIKFHSSVGRIAAATPEDIQDSLPADVLTDANRPISANGSNSPNNAESAASEPTPDSLAERDGKLAEFAPAKTPRVSTVRFPVYQPDASTPTHATVKLILHTPAPAKQAVARRSGLSLTTHTHSRHSQAHRLRHRRRHRRHRLHAHRRGMQHQALHRAAAQVHARVSQVSTGPVVGTRIASASSLRFGIAFWG